MSFVITFKHSRQTALPTFFQKGEITMQEWTIMVYMAGDNNLSSDMAYALGEIKSVANDLGITPNDRVSFLAYYDSGALTVPSFNFDFTNPAAPIRKITNKETIKRFRTKNELKALAAKHAGVTVEDESVETSSATAYGIMNFVDWCINQQGHKATNYALIFSGHSFGFHGTSFMRDENPVSYMTIDRFKWALEQVVGEQLLGQKIGILGFDSCVMSMLEIGYEFRALADFLVASEGSIPNAGWGYGNIIRHFAANTSPKEAREVAEQLVKSYIERQQDSAIGGQSIDISAWDLGKVEAVAKAVNDLGKTLYTKLNLPAKGNDLLAADIVVYEQLNRALLQSHWNCQTYMHDQCVDLKDFCQQLLIEHLCLEKQIETIFGAAAIAGETGNVIRENFWQQIAEIKTALQNVISAIDACVVLCGFCGEEYQFSNGISLFFPWSELAYFITKSRYEILEFTKEIGRSWDDFLAFYVCLATKRLPRKEGWSFQIGFEKLTELSAEQSLNRDNLPFKRDNLPFKRDNLPFKRGESGGYLEYFGRLKNFPLYWDVSGYAKDFNEDSGCKYFEWLQNR